MTKKYTVGFEHALDLAEKGWYVYPSLAKSGIRCCTTCAEDDNGKRACGTTNHRPGEHGCTGHWCHGYHAATNDLDYIEQHWPSSEKISCSIATGPSGLVVLDCDGPEGTSWFEKGVAAGWITPTLTLVSASGTGRHVVYKGSLPTWDRAAGFPVDVKSADRGTIRWTGNVLHDAPVATIPTRLADYLRRPERPAPAYTPRPADGDLNCPRIGADGKPVHRSPSFLARGVEIEVERLEAIQPIDGTGRTEQVKEILRRFVARHGCCATEADYDRIREASKVSGKPASRGWQHNFGIPSQPAS